MPLVRVAGNAFAVILGGQKEGCSVSHVASVTLQDRGVGESFLSSLQKLTDMPVEVLRVMETLAQLRG